MQGASEPRLLEQNAILARDVKGSAEEEFICRSAAN